MKNRKNKFKGTFQVKKFNSHSKSINYMNSRKELPIFSHKNEILQLLDKEDVFF